MGKCSLSSGVSPSAAGQKGKGDPSQWEGQTGVQGMLSARQTFSPPSRASPFPLQDKQAVLGAVDAMMAVLLHEEQHQEHAWEQLLWLVHQYQEVRDTSRVTKVRCCAGPGMAAGEGPCEWQEALGSCGVPGGAGKPFKKEQGEQRRPGASQALWARKEKPGAGRREASVPGAHLLRKGGITASLGLRVWEELCLNAQAHVESCPVRGKV